VDLTNMTTDIVASVIPLLYDSDGNIIDKSELTLNMTTVTVTAKILDIKDVSLIFNVTGTPATGYAYMDMEYEPATIAIKGTASALNNVTALNIPESALDISGARGDITQVIDVTEYLPSGVTIADKDQAKVTVTVHIAQLSTKVLNIFPSSIQVLHLPDDYELTFDPGVIRVNLSGIREDIEALDTSDIVVSIDAGQLTPGTHEVELALDLEDNIYHEPVTTVVTVTEKTEADDAQTGDDDAQDTTGQDDAGQETENVTVQSQGNFH
jgi:YbbR domain-containing protein